MPERSVDAAPTGPIGDVRSAWGSVGWTGRCCVFGAWTSCLMVSIAWLATTWRVVGTGVALAVLVLAALVDAVEHRLPNALVAMAVVPVGAAVVSAWSADVGRSTLLGAAFVAVPLLLTHLVAPAGMGFGDVKAGLVLGAAVGLVDAQLALLALVLGLASGAAFGLVRRARSIPLGPFLVAGAIASLVVGRAVGLGT